MFAFIKDVEEVWKLQELENIINDFDSNLYDAVNALCLKNENNYENIVIHIAGKSIVTFREVISLCALGFPDGALSLARNLFEQLIVLSFFESKKNSPDFLDFVHDYCLDIENKTKRAFQFEYEYISNDEQKLKDCRKSLNELLNESATNKAKGDYWWSGHPSFASLMNYVISSEINDEDMRKHLRLLQYAYKRACISLHSNSLGNSIRLGNKIDFSVIDTAPKTDGFELPLWFATSCFIMVVGVTCNMYKIKSDIYLKKLNELASFYKLYKKN